LLRHKKRLALTENQLIEGCRKNKRKYQKRLYDQYCDAMYTVAFRMVNDTDLASDVLQEAFIQVFRDIHQFRGDATIGSWIKTIVVRSALKKLKTESWNIPIEDVSNGELIEWPDEMLGEDLEKAILSLPAGYRSIFLLVEVEGYKHKEVAEMLGVSEGTSKSQLFYAKKLLQKRLKEFYRA
jgi:RNA polymerase sigma-70 factor (ECF subfamily)